MQDYEDWYQDGIILSPWKDYTWKRKVIFYSENISSLLMYVKYIIYIFIYNNVY